MSQLIPSDSLPMGTAPDGRSLSLNLATGRVDLGGVPDPSLQLLAAVRLFGQHTERLLDALRVRRLLG